METFLAIVGCIVLVAWMVTSWVSWGKNAEFYDKEKELHKLREEAREREQSTERSD